MKYIIIILVLLGLGIGGYYLYSKMHEHPGSAISEHPGDSQGESQSEHPGQEEKEHSDDVKKEHPGDSKLERKYFLASDIKKAMLEYIQSGTDDKTLKGAFHMYDSKTKQTLNLQFVKIHDPVRMLKGKGYFACTDFEVVGEPGKLYDLDFWLNPENNKLVMTESKIHKEPADAEGNKIPRYTFKDDEIVEIN